MDSGFDAVKSLILEGSGDTEDFIRWVPTHEKLPIEHIGGIDHTLAVWCQEGNVFGLLEIFGDVPFLLKLGEGIASENFFFGYVVNPLRDTTPAENRKPIIDISQIPAFADSPAKPNPVISKVFKIRISRIAQKLFESGIANQFDQIVDEVFLPHYGKPITEEMATEYMVKMREFIDHLVPTPLKTNKCDV